MPPVSVDSVLEHVRPAAKGEIRGTHDGNRAGDGNRDTEVVADEKGGACQPVCLLPACRSLGEHVRLVRRADAAGEDPADDGSEIAPITRITNTLAIRDLRRVRGAEPLVPSFA